jgi:Fe-S-cluster containining protein
MNLKSFKTRAYRKRKDLTSFLKRLQRKAPVGMDALARETDKEVWTNIDCLTCANCCKTMTPTYLPADIKRIAAHLNMTPAALKEKYFKTDEDNGDIVNQHTPCQWLDLKTNFCSIYEARPKDCSGFPHLKKKDVLDYTHVYTDNLHRCPATLKWAESMQKKVIEQGILKR